MVVILSGVFELCLIGSYVVCVYLIVYVVLGFDIDDYVMGMLYVCDGMIVDVYMVDFGVCVL